MKITFPIVAVIAVFCNSCARHDSEFKQLEGRIFDSVGLVNQCHRKVSYVDLQNELLRDIRNQSDAGERRTLARVWAERVRGVIPSLCGTDYSGFYHAVRRFNLSLGYSATALEESEPDAEFRFSYYIEMLQRFKSACFAIPWSGRFKDETFESYNDRMNAALVSLNEFEYEMSRWERFIMPKLLENVPADRQNEFKKTFQELKRHPSQGDLRNAFIQGCKGESDSTPVK